MRCLWCSLIPFTSPIVMMVRVAMGSAPIWQLLLSMALLDRAPSSPPRGWLADLPHRHPHVRQEGELEGDGEMVVL
jgi:hypothetical protein